MQNEAKKDGIEKTPLERNMTGADKKDNRDGKDETVDQRKSASERENENPADADPVEGDYLKTDPKLEKHPNDR